MNISRPQQRMFCQLTAEPQDVHRIPGVRNQFQTARALAKRGLAVLEPESAERWTIRLSDDWLRLEQLERSINACEGTNIEHTAKHKARVEELDNLYARFRS